MDNKRTALLAGLLILILVGLGVGWFLLNPPPGAQPDHAADTRAPAKFKASSADDRTYNDAPPDVRWLDADPLAKRAIEPIKIEPAERPALVSVSGKALDYADDPAPGVALTLLAEEGDTASGPAVTTSADGAFRFETELMVGKTYFVACIEQGKALTATAAFKIEEGKAVEGLIIRVYDAARAFGVVLNAADKTPLPGVSIRLDARTDERLQRLGRILGRCKPVRSDEQGKFAIEGVAPGKYLAYAEKPGWTAHEFDPTTRGRQEIELAEFANLEMLPFVLIQAGIIEGYVLKESDRTPVAGASVELGTVIGGTLAMTSTDETGFYRFDTAPPASAGGGDGGPMGEVAVRALAPGFAMASRELRVRSGEKRENINLLLKDGTTLTGHVVNSKLEPVAGASVYFNDNNALRDSETVAGVVLPKRAVTTTTGADGTFTLTNLPMGTASIAARAQGYAVKTEHASTTGTPPPPVTIILEAEGWIEGLVTNPRGEPVAGVALAAYDVTAPGQVGFVMKSLFGEVLPDRGESTMFPANVRSGEDGTYRIDALPAGKYIVVANTRSYQKHISGELAVKTGAATVHNIRLEIGGTIFGRVYDSTGKGESGVPVTCANIFGQETARVRTAYTDAGGNYEVTGLTPGAYNVVRNTGDPAALFMPSQKNQVKVAAGERVQFDIYDQKPGTARIYGRVTEDGVPYAEKQIVLIGGNYTGFTTETTRTDKNGDYEFVGVPLGFYQVAQSAGPFPTLVRRRVNVNREGDFEFDVAFQTVKITGKVILEGGKVPVGRVRVIASPVNPQSGDSGTTEERVNDFEMLVFREANGDEKTGEFELPGLSPGFYRVTARSDTQGMVTRPYVNLRVTVTGLVLTLPGEGATIKGTVAGLDGAANNTPFGLIAALTIEDERGQPLALGGFDNGINLTESKTFEVKNLPEGTFTATLSLTGYTPSTHVVKLKNGEATALTFTFASSGNLKIALLNKDIDIETALALEYEIRNSKGELFKKRFTFLDFFAQDAGATQSADDNSFTVRDLPPETYKISLTLPGYKTAVREFTITAGETAAITVEFSPE